MESNPEQAEPIKTESETAEKPAQEQSEQSKKANRGGKRPGAGRKPNLAKRLLKGVTRDTIIAACSDIDVGTVVAGLLKSRSERTRLEALNFVFDRVLGKPKQDIGVSGGIIHAHTRDPLLASLPKEALEALAHAYDDVLARYALPVAEVAAVSNASPDSPQNQIESKPAIEVQGLESEAGECTSMLQDGSRRAAFG